MKILIILSVFVLSGITSFAQNTLGIIVKDPDKGEFSVMLDDKELASGTLLDLSRIKTVQITNKTKNWDFDVQFSNPIEPGVAILKGGIDFGRRKTDILIDNHKFPGNENFLLNRSANIIITKNGKKVSKVFELTPPAPTEIKAFTIPYYDALTLIDTTNITPSKFESIKATLAYYADMKNYSLSDLKSAYKDNPFLRNYVKELENIRHYIIKESDRPSEYSAQSFITSVGSLDVTNIADGMAKFIIKRAREELTIAFFDKFKDMINSNDYRDLKSIFPETYNALHAIDNEIYQFSAYMQTLRECFEKDLRELTAHLPSIIDNHTEFFERNNDLKALLLSGCYIAEGFRFNEHPGYILSNFPEEFLDSLNMNWKGPIQTLKLFSSSFRDSSALPDSKYYWVSSADIKKLISNRNIFSIYLGLIFQQAQVMKNKNKPIIFTSSTGLLDILQEAGDNFNYYYANYKSYFDEIGSRANKLASIMNDIDKTKSDSLKLELYFNFLNESVNFMETTTNIEKLLPKDKTINGLNQNSFRKIKLSLNNYFDLVRSSLHLVWDIKRRSYASALVNVVRIYDIVRPQLTESENESYNNQIAALERQIQMQNNKYSQTMLASVNTNIERDLAAGKTDINDLKKELNEIKKIIDDVKKSPEVKNSLIKYGTFAATIVEAKNSDQVGDAIEAFALPAGSAIIKRESFFNVAFNAYAGFSFGYEHLTGLDNSRIKLNNYGIASPVGITASWGHTVFGISTGDNSWSTSIFVSVLDLGAIASFRVNNDTVKSIPTVQLKDIISPGLFLSIGLPKFPISLNLGVQLGPNLHEVTAAENKFNDALYWRYNFSICVDIPLLNLYTSPRLIK